jgi:hypothetical protein
MDDFDLKIGFLLEADERDRGFGLLTLVPF